MKPTSTALFVRRRSHPSARRQRGVTLFGLVFWAVLVAFVAYVLVRALPTVNEYVTIQTKTALPTIFSSGTKPQ